MNHLTEKLTAYILSEGTIQKEDCAIYQYGLQTGMEMILCMVISCSIAIYLESFLEFLFFVTVFFPLRAYFGGIHMRYFLSCLFCSCTVITCVLILVKKYVFVNQISLLFIILLLFGIYKLESVMMKNQNTDYDETYFFKKQQKRILTIVGVLALIFFILGVSTLETLLMYTLFVIFSSMTSQQLKNVLSLDEKSTKTM